MSPSSTTGRGAGGATFLALILVIAGTAGCGRCGGGGGKAVPPDAAAGGAGAGAHVPEAAAAPLKVKDERGVLAPQEELPFGVPVPVRMGKVFQGATWCRYEGTWSPEEVLAFYRAYLTLPEGRGAEQRGTAWIFADAHPKSPGNTGRLVEVRVSDEREFGTTAVLIFDVAAKALEKQKEKEVSPPYNPNTWKPARPGDLPPDELM
jgi:hypothetical protein